jgi:hypothetical protein
MYGTSRDALETTGMIENITVSSSALESPVT